MNLQWLIDNTSNKVIRIESVNSYGELGMQVELVVKDAELNKTGWRGYQLVVNEEINLYFSGYRRDMYCKNVLNLYRSNEEMVCICLPEDDVWTDEYVNGYLQY